MKLILRIGFYADAAAVNMWRVAQEFWGRGRTLLPKEIFDKLEYAPDLIAVGLADVRDSSVYVRGSSEYLEWHHQKREQAIEAGKKSAESRRIKLGSAQPKGGRGQKITERDPNENRTEGNGTEPSGSLSGSGLSKITLPSGESATGVAPLPDLAVIWNENCGEQLAKVKKTNPARNRAAKIRFSENTPQEWAGLIRKVAASDFCIGKNDRNWKATFDWLLRPDSHLRVSEGKYDNGHGHQGQADLSSIEWTGPEGSPEWAGGRA